MSELEEFEEWCEKEYGFRSHKLCMLLGIDLEKSWQACAKRKEAELAALRGFANDLLTSSYIGYIDEKYLSMKMRKYFLLDEESNPTKLLTGEE